MNSPLRRLGPGAAVLLWAVVAPLACLVAGAAIIGRAAQAAALRTAVVASAATLTAGAPRQPAATSLPEVHLAVAEPTSMVGATLTPTVSRRTPVPTATAPPTRTSTPAASKSATATTTPEPGPPNPSELVIGTSVAGRPLTVTVFGSGPVMRLIVAGIHGGNEWNTTALAHALLAHLHAQPERLPPDVTLYILPLLNPDGAARGTDIYARANDHNVDLNRNWPSRWQPDWSREGCWRYLRLSGGTQAGSEPEVQALMQFMLDYHIDAVISYHSAALGIFAGGQPPDAASLSLAEAVAAVSDYPWPPLDFGCVYTGQLIDWASEQGAAALDVELTNHRDTDLEQNLRILDTFLAWRR